VDEILVAGLPDISRYNIPKWEKIYQMATHYTKWPYNRANGHIIYQDHPISPKSGFFV
jgi:hypothetical protein